MTGADLAAAAETLIGTRFRLHGRDPATGLDCIGLFAAALALCGRRIAMPTGYSLRLNRIEPWLPEPLACGFAPAEPPFLAGDVIMLIPGPAQYHLAIAARTGGWVHAHAGLKRTVLQPGRPDGTIIHHWRLLPTT